MEPSTEGQSRVIELRVAVVFRCPGCDWRAVRWGGWQRLPAIPSILQCPRCTAPDVPARLRDEPLTSMEVAMLGEVTRFDGQQPPAC